MIVSPILKNQFQPYAITDDNSRGRISVETFHKKDIRSEFQHDRDRIIHSAAFKKLVGKSQLVLIHDSDHSRTRLTHSLEVGQIAESIATQLGLNTFATLAIALAHDVGHTPFGHTGERAVSSILTDHGLQPFQHNYQSVLIVNKLEQRYKKSDGLNLMWETRDGILKHSALSEDIDLSYYDPQLNQSFYPVTLEGQIVRIVDGIARRAHDTDDGLRTGILDIKELTQKDIIKNSIIENNLSIEDIIDGFSTNKGSLNAALITSTLVTSIMKYYVLKTLENTYRNLKKMNITTYDDVLNSKDLIIDWDDRFKRQDHSFAKEYLKPRFYEHSKIRRMDTKTEAVFSKIFTAYKLQPRRLPQNIYHLYLTAVKDYLTTLVKSNENSSIASEINSMLQKEKIPCEDACSFIPKSDVFNPDQSLLSNCPLTCQGHACEGIRVIINHIADMTDKKIDMEYERLYFSTKKSDVLL